MKSSKIWKAIWMIGIYAILSLILYLVVLYKVEWEHKDLNMYLYFYDCNKSLCTSVSRPKGYYNKVLCQDGICPYIEHIIDDNVILNNGNSNYIYNYIENRIVNNSYVNYRYIGKNEFIVSNGDNKQGVIDFNGNILVDIKYDYIDDYDNGNVVYRIGNMYGVDTLEQANNVEPIFEHIVLINDMIYAGRLDNTYKIYSYNDINSTLGNEYNYVYSYNDILIVAYNNKLDILTTDFNSTLLMKINAFFEYKTEKERNSLNIYNDGNYIYFRVYTSEYDYVDYSYDIFDKQLIN